jgi:hypothetical protein
VKLPGPAYRQAGTARGLRGTFRPNFKILYIEYRRKNQCDLTNDIDTNKIKFLVEKGEMT